MSAVPKAQWLPWIQERAAALGLEAVGVVPPEPGPERARFLQWLHQGLGGEMAYLYRDPHRRTDPRVVLPGVQSILLVAMNYYPGHRASLLEDPTRGYIANYALGRDYHRILQKRLQQLLREMQVHLSPEIQGRVYVDTGPLLEKALAERAGLGWIGKHTNLILPRKGSWYFLGALLLNCPLPTQEPGRNHCGRCTRCIDVCPTRAIVAPYVLDARRCIAYLTIEYRGPIPEALRPQMGNRIFGCDDCQWVCPWNRFARKTREMAFLPRGDWDQRSLIQWMELDEAGFHHTFAGTPVRRLKRGPFLRNVAVALGNSRDPQALPVLKRALRDPDPLVREHSAWAIQQIQRHRAPRLPETRTALQERRLVYE